MICPWFGKRGQLPLSEQLESFESKQRQQMANINVPVLSILYIPTGRPIDIYFTHAHRK
jgi:hypothetical protein